MVRLGPSRSGRRSPVDPHISWAWREDKGSQTRPVLRRTLRRLSTARRNSRTIVVRTLPSYCFGPGEVLDGRHPDPSHREARTARAHKLDGADSLGDAVLSIIILQRYMRFRDFELKIRPIGTAQLQTSGFEWGRETVMRS